MAFTKPAFLPEEGWENGELFPTRPYSEADTRRLLNLMHTQLRDYIANTLLPELEEAGAASIGSPALPGLTDTEGLTVWQLLCYLAKQMQQLSGGTVADGSVTDAKLDGSAEALKSRFAAHAGGAGHSICAQTQGDGTRYTAQSGMDIEALGVGAHVLLLPHTDNEDAPTLALDDAEEQVLCDHGGEPLAAGVLRAGRPYSFVYDGTCLRGELALTKADSENARLYGAARVESGGSLTVAGTQAGAVSVKNLCVLGSGENIPELAEGDVVLIVD